METNRITENIIGAAIDVHKSLGPGLLESVYKQCLAHRLRMQSDLLVEQEVPVSLIYDEVKLEIGYRLDLLVEKQVVVEIKSVDCLHEIHFSQMITYLKLGKFRTGLLINFNVVRLKDGIKRLAG